MSSITVNSIMNGKTEVLRKDVYKYFEDKGLRYPLHYMDKRIEWININLGGPAGAAIAGVLIAALFGLGYFAGGIPSVVPIVAACFGGVMSLTAFVIVIVLLVTKKKRLNEKLQSKEVSQILKDLKEALKLNREQRRKTEEVQHYKKLKNLEYSIRVN